MSDLYITIWQRAKEEEIGLAVATPDLRRLSAELYRTRDLLKDPDLQHIRICFPPNGELWLVKNTITVIQ